MRRGQRNFQKSFDRPGGIGDEFAKPRQSLILLRIKRVTDEASKKGARRLVAMASLLEPAFGIDKHIGDGLGVADLVCAAAYIEEGIETRRGLAGRVELQADLITLTGLIGTQSAPSQK
jgi:hypothetical protein